MLRLSTRDPGFAQAFARLVANRRDSDASVARDVAHIIEDVRRRGDAAVTELTARYDQYTPTQDSDWSIGAEQCREAYDALLPDLRAALELAAQRIKAFHAQQLPKNRDHTDDAGVGLARAGALSTRRGSTFRAVAQPIRRHC